MINITSRQNKYIKQAIALKSKKERDKTKLFIAEGEKLTKEIPKDWNIEYFIISENYFNSLNKADFNKKAFLVSNELFLKISDTITPQGILAICEQKNFNQEILLTKENPLFILLERVSDPGNLGTLIRTADAAGADAVFLSNGCVDLYNSKVIRATMGSIFHLPIITNSDFNILIDKLKNKFISVFSSHLKGTKSLYDINLKKGCAILIGNEATGLSDEIAQKSDCLIKIPMIGKSESINASVAGSIFIYEAVRQRII